jgi:hypothetical protein
MGTLNILERTLKELQIPFKMRINGVKVYVCVLNKKLVEVSLAGDQVFVHFTATEDNSILFENMEAFKDWIDNGTL